MLMQEMRADAGRENKAKLHGPFTAGQGRRRMKARFLMMANMSVLVPCREFKAAVPAFGNQTYFL
jgi:hypothetical protein